MNDKRLDELLEEAFNEPMSIEKKLLNSVREKTSRVEQKLVFKEIYLPIVLIIGFNLVYLMKLVFWIRQCMLYQVINIHLLDVGIFWCCILILIYFVSKAWINEKVYEV